MKLAVSSVALGMFLVRCSAIGDSRDSGEGSSDIGRRHEYYWNTNRPCNYTEPDECLAAGNLTVAGGYRIECAWMVPTREIQYCWTNSDGQNVCTEEGNQLSCGYCANVFARGHQYSDPATVSCESIRDMGITEPDSDGDRPVIYCQNDTVPDYVSEVCYNASKPIWQLEMCFEVECEREDTACDAHEAEYNCSRLVQDIIDSADEYRGCNRYAWWDYHGEDWDSNREECRQSCPGFFEEGMDYYKCVDLWEYFAYYYCASNQTWVSRYSEACPLLEASMLCDIANCTRRHCQRDCPQYYTDCYFEDGCYDELNGFRLELGEYDSLSPMLAQPLTNDTFNERCRDGCGATFEAVYECAWDVCLPQSCLLEKCEMTWDECYESNECRTALNYTLEGVGYFVEDRSQAYEDDLDSVSQTTDDAMYTEEMMDSCCRVCDENDNEVSDTDSDECSDSSFECGRCDERFYGLEGDELEDRPEGVFAEFVLGNHMRWFYEFDCGDGDFCENEQMQSVLECITPAHDSECAARSNMSDTCRSECMNKVYDCFSDEDCGEEYSVFARREQACMESGSDNEECNGWRNMPGMEDRGIMYWQYQCWSDGGCSEMYSKMWQCRMQCAQREYTQRDCALDLGKCVRSEDDGSSDDSSSSMTAGNGLQSCMLDGCQQSVNECNMDQECYVNMTRFIRWSDHSNITAGYREYLRYYPSYSPGTDSFRKYVKRDYCEFIGGGADCTEKFYSVVDCTYEGCISASMEGYQSYYTPSPIIESEYCFMGSERTCEQQINGCLDKGVCFNESYSFNTVGSGGGGGYGGYRRRRMYDKSDSRSYSNVRTELLKNLQKYDRNDKGTFEEKEAMNRDAYFRGCADVTGERCSELWKAVITCVGDECIFKSPETEDEQDHAHSVLGGWLGITVTLLILVFTG